MHDNAPAHTSKKTGYFLSKNLVDKSKLMIWPPYSPDLNPIENLWSMLKQRVYAGNKQFSDKKSLWNAIETQCNNFSPAEIKKLTSSIDSRIMSIFQKNGDYIGK